MREDEGSSPGQSPSGALPHFTPCMVRWTLLEFPGKVWVEAQMSLPIMILLFPERDRPSDRPEQKRHKLRAVIPEETPAGPTLHTYSHSLELQDVLQLFMLSLWGPSESLKISEIPDVGQVLGGEFDPPNSLSDLCSPVVHPLLTLMGFLTIQPSTFHLKSILWIRP